jgi:NADPH2:quinone reductase
VKKQQAAAASKFAVEEEEARERKTLKGKEEEMLRQKKHLAEVVQLVADGVIDLVIEEHVSREIDSLNAAYHLFDQRSHFGKVSITM